MRFEFNTGRAYKADGQIIKCECLWSDKLCAYVIAFNDVSRGIPGWLVYSGRTAGDEGLRHMREAVLAAYDNYAYAQGTFRA